MELVTSAGFTKPLLQSMEACGGYAQLAWTHIMAGALALKI